jgi:hypothetical protein
MSDERANAGPSGRSLAALKRLRGALQLVQKRSFGAAQRERDSFSIAAHAADPHHELEFCCAVDEMRSAGVNARLIYATVKLGRVVTVDSFAELSARDLAVWNSALEEYDAGVTGRVFAA